MWMSHGDKLHGVPEGFKAVGTFYVTRPYLDRVIVLLVRFCLFSLVQLLCD